MASAARKKVSPKPNRRSAGRTPARKRARARRRAPRAHAARQAVTPAVVPMLSYEDGIAALDWLGRAFGFQEIARHIGPDGRLSHGEMEVPGGSIMLATPTPDYQSPKRHREVCEQARRWSTVPWVIDGVLVYVADIERHFRRAKSAGATILSEIEEGRPGRRYRAEDLEGHRWFFMQVDDA